MHQETANDYGKTSDPRHAVPSGTESVRLLRMLLERIEVMDKKISAISRFPTGQATDIRKNRTGPDTCFE